MSDFLQEQSASPLSLLSSRKICLPPFFHLMDPAGDGVAFTATEKKILQGIVP